MIRPIVHDPIFLAQKSEPATQADIAVGEDLLDTLKANQEACVGMAANMIGVKKRILVFNNQGCNQLMFNPEIIKKSGAYKTVEGCLSLVGQRETTRYQSIKVRYFNAHWQLRIKNFTGWEAQILQHEMDHFEGILI